MSESWRTRRTDGWEYLSKMMSWPNPWLPPAPQPAQFPALQPLTWAQRQFLQSWIIELRQPPDALVVFHDWFVDDRAAICEAVGEWLASTAVPWLQLPKRRTMAQWINWLRAEGYLELLAQPGWGPVL